jgi:replicative DNA helicase
MMFDLEKKLLICLLADYDNQYTKKIILSVKSDYFYNPTHRDIFKLILKQHDTNQPTNFIDFLCAIPKNDNDMYTTVNNYLIDSTNNVYIFYDDDLDKLSASYYLRIKCESLTKLLHEAKNSTNPEDTLKGLSTNLATIAQLSDVKTQGLTLAQAAEAHHYDKTKQDKIKTIPQLDNLVGGFNPSLATFAAGAGVGKTFFAIYLFDNILRNYTDCQGLFFSLEMTYKDIIERQKAVRANKVYRRLSEQEMDTVTLDLMQAKGRIYDISIAQNCTDIDYICTTAKLEHAQTKVKVIVVDYMTAITTTKRFERDDLKYKYIAQRLAQLAVELNCLVINLIHINRNSNLRSIDDRCPNAGDEIASQGSYIVSGYWFGLDRPYLHTNYDKDKNRFLLALRKNRFGTFSGILETCFNAGLFGAPFVEYAPVEKKSKDDYG